VETTGGRGLPTGQQAQVDAEFTLEGVHADARPTRSNTRSKLLAGTAKARGWVDELIAGRVLDIADLAGREKRSVRSTAMLLSLAFLAPNLVQAIADNRLPAASASLA
jgi:hypothetical protein